VSSERDPTIAGLPRLIVQGLRRRLVPGQIVLHRRNRSVRPLSVGTDAEAGDLSPPDGVRRVVFSGAQRPRLKPAMLVESAKTRHRLLDDTTPDTAATAPPSGRLKLW